MNNSKDKLTEELANVLNETAEASHIAFAAFRTARIQNGRSGMLTIY